MNICTDNTYTIGNTPLVRLSKLAKGLKADVLGKVEGRNPAYSVKCRTAASIVWEAEKSGNLKPGMTIVEGTSGNTGIALAMCGAARGYKVALAMPESMSMERRKILKALGAELVLTPAGGGMSGAVNKAIAMAKGDPEKYFLADQFGNPANPLIHFETTGPEIWEATEGTVDVVVAGVGTGGTVTGIGRYLQDIEAGVTIVAVEPEESPILSQHRDGISLTPAGHGIQGIGANFIPANVDFSVINRIEQCNTEEAMETSRKLSNIEGMLSGISCGAAAAVALRLAAMDEFDGKRIVAILPDSGERYLSTALFDM
ncbi:MAG: cysteine synthase A [Kiritimatiellae bacterium]|jgi:cysteine synthase A|nr:cysteine synthase A [Kiritimatiellia bacterium]